ncbi:MAG TPA: hypothetical protein VNW71_15960, partial [Thermoanaerobaculia bacterium]|nr:hypothetical protein [Thermoanaerobaculia bacterium]
PGCERVSEEEIGVELTRRLKTIRWVEMDCWCISSDDATNANDLPALIDEIEPIIYTPRA